MCQDGQWMFYLGEPKGLIYAAAKKKYWNKLKDQSNNISNWTCFWEMLGNHTVMFKYKSSKECYTLQLQESQPI